MVVRNGPPLSETISLEALQLVKLFVELLRASYREICQHAKWKAERVFRLEVSNCQLPSGLTFRIS